MQSLFASFINRLPASSILLLLLVCDAQQPTSDLSTDSELGLENPEVLLDDAQQLADFEVGAVR
jgi:hypothetical protein